MDSGLLNPLISIIIPALNSEKTIEQCINSIISQSYPREKYEIIVIDGVSNDNSVKISKKAGADSVLIEKCTPGRSRNIGAKNAQGKLLVFLDSDCEAKDGWLSTIENELKTKDAITGPLLNGTKGLISWAEYLLKFSDFNEYKKESTVKFLIGGNQACKRDVFVLAGGFPDKLTAEDVALGKSLSDVGVTCYFIPSMKVLHLGGATKITKFFVKMEMDGTYIARSCQEVPSIYTKYSNDKWKIFAVFIIKFGARILRAKRAKKLGLFFVSLPLILLGIGYFCKGFMKEMH